MANDSPQAFVDLYNLHQALRVQMLKKMNTPDDRTVDYLFASKMAQLCTIYLDTFESAIKDIKCFELGQQGNNDK